MDNNTYQQIRDIDCSQTKKYTKWLVKQYNISHFDINLIGSYIEEYQTLSIRQLINSDIYSFKSLYDFISAIDNANEIKTATRKELEYDYDVIIDNENFLIMRPNTHEASRKIGLTYFKHRKNKNTNQLDSAWCTTYANSSHWDSYYKNLKTLYYCKVKKKELLDTLNELTNNFNYFKVFACLVDENNELTFFDAHDRKIEESGIIFDYLIKHHNFKTYILPNIENRVIKNEISEKNILEELNNEIIWDDVYLEPHMINDDINVGCKIIEGNLTLKNFNKIPNFFKDIKVKGDFICYENNFTTLENMPQYVGGGVRCWGSLLSLKGIAKYIGGSIDISSNYLTNLEYCPKVVNGSFICRHNKLTTLKGAPKVIKGLFECSANNLTNLKYAPKKVFAINLHNNNILSLKGCPYITGNNYNCEFNMFGSILRLNYLYIFSDNNINDLTGLQKEIFGSIDLSNNELKSLDKCPSKIHGNLFCTNNPLEDLTHIPKYIKGKFIIDENQLIINSLS